MYEEEFQGKKELAIHRFNVLGFKTTESKLSLLEEYYEQAIKQCLVVILISLLVIWVVFIL